jgi:Tol biopolymer transport system component
MSSGARRSLAAAAITTLALGAGAGSAQAASKLVYADFDGSDQIFTVRSDGTHRHEVTTGTAFKSGPAWSPDHRRIVYSRVKDAPARLVVIRPNGTHRHVIPHIKFAVDPSWAPNGKRIAFSDKAANPEATKDIYTVKVNGTGRKNITNSRPALTCTDIPDECRRDDEWPAWSPNGKRLVFDETTSGGDPSLYTVKPGDTVFTQLTPSGSDPDW